ncbi:hypothetical protein MCOR02_002930 [Pyricularia oryzae]|nr:hypothetical protein MCOR02_002930 [Pyricularia oryzae]
MGQTWNEQYTVMRSRAVLGSIKKGLLARLGNSVLTYVVPWLKLPKFAMECGKFENGGYNTQGLRVCLGDQFENHSARGALRLFSLLHGQGSLRRQYGSISARAGTDRPTF